MSKIRLQGPENFGGFSHDGQSYAADDDGVVEVPAHLPSEVLAAHGLKPAPAKIVKPLAKAAKGVADETVSDATDKVVEGEPVKAKGAKAAKGGAE